jgi:hypothetical protein
MPRQTRAAAEAAQMVPADDTAADSPALHGHYDGPRGHSDEHRHPAGDKPHGHPAGDRQLGRVAEVAQYVHGSRLPQARRLAKLEPAGLDEVDTTQPLDQRPTGTAVVPAHLDDAQALASATDRAVKLARNAEHNRFAAAYTADVNLASGLIELLVEVGDRHSDKELADPATIRKLQAQVESWALQRGLNGDGDGGS